MSLWRTARPSHEQTEAMTYDSYPDDMERPRWELRRFAELVLEFAEEKANKEEQP
jgi:hypothetical protein